MQAAVGVRDSREPPASPAERPLFVQSASIALRAVEGKGRGWFAQGALPAGTMVLIERPVAAVLDIEWRDRPWSECASADTAALGVRLAERFSPSLAEVLSLHHPKSDAPLPDLEEDFARAKHKNRRKNTSTNTAHKKQTTVNIQSTNKLQINERTPRTRRTRRPSTRLLLLLLLLLLVLSLLACI